ncbi:MAG: GlsB/YeaQ/YmgE family stress response membrane protein [Gaiellaceae bacterium]
MSMIVHIIGLILLGLVVGALGRFFHPGQDRMGLLMTMGIGVASVLIAGLLVGGILGFVVAVVVGVVLVALWSHLVEPRRKSRARRALHI